MTFTIMSLWKTHDPSPTVIMLKNGVPKISTTEAKVNKTPATITMYGRTFTINSRRSPPIPGSFEYSESNQAIITTL